MAADDVPGPRKQPRFKGTGAPATAADLNILGDHAALVGNRKVGTTAERTAATAAGEVWDGLLWKDTTLNSEFEYYSGLPGWLPVSEVTITAGLSFGTGFATTAGAQNVPRLSRVGRRVFLDGAVTSSAGFNYVNILTVPAAYQPATAGTRPVGPAIVSNAMTGEYFLTAGQLSLLYASGTIPVGNSHPLNCSWVMD